MMVRTIAARSTASSDSTAAAEAASAARTDMIAIAVVMSRRPALKPLLVTARAICLDGAMRAVLVAVALVRTFGPARNSITAHQGCDCAGGTSGTTVIGSRPRNPFR